MRAWLIRFSQCGLVIKLDLSYAVILPYNHKLRLYFYVSIAEASDLLESKTWWSEYFILLYFSYNSDSGFWDEYCQLSRKNNTPHLFSVMNKACRDFLSSHHLYMLWSSSSVSYQFCCYFIKFSTLSWILVRPLHCQCYAQSTLSPRPTQKQVGEEPGNEAEAQLPAAVRELRPRQNEPRPERAAEIDLTSMRYPGLPGEQCNTTSSQTWIKLND